MKRLLGLLGILLVVAAGRFAYRLTDRPSLAAYHDLRLEAAPPARGALRVTFLGTATLLFEDGDTSILVDGFFSRPNALRTLVAKVAPDRAVIDRTLERAGIKSLAAVITVHSHYDHAMDSPIVAEKTGALLVGSESTANIGRGLGLEEDAIRVIKDGDRLTFGRFVVTVYRSNHFPHGMAMGEITAPLVPPARALKYLEGGSYSLLIEHDGRTLLVQGSAGFIDGALRGKHAEVVFLGVAGLGTRDDAYRDAYWREVVEAVGAKRVIPIHWDDFTLSLDRPLEPLPSLIDDIPLSIRYLAERAKAEKIDFRFAPEWQRVDPFAGLATER
jgi:L-ascorbate metabolism protein UlaG (beta-lactamase superfamily)